MIKSTFAPVRPRYKVGDIVFCIHLNLPISATIIGFKIKPMRSDQINPFLYQIATDDATTETWLHEEDLFHTFANLLEHFRRSVEAWDCSYSELAEFNTLRQ